MAPKNSVLKKSLLAALEAAEAGLDGLPIPLVKGCVSGIRIIIEQEDLRKSNADAYEKLLEKIKLIQDVVLKPLSQLIPDDTPERLEQDILTFAEKLRRVPDEYNQHRGSLEHSVIRRIKDFFNAGDNEELLNDMADGIEEAIQFFQLSADVNHQLTQHNTRRLLEAEYLLKDLPEAPSGGRFELCEEGTRTSILQEARAWVQSERSVCQQILWLNGPAGSGKSTIANTLATHFFNQAILGGKFTFSSTVSGKLLFPTVARQLAQHDAGFKLHLAKSITSRSKFFDSVDIATQFEYLVLEPLLKLPPHRKVVVVILDALDECDRREDVVAIISVIVSNIHRLPFLRVFMTSRREHYIGQAIKLQTGQVRDIDINHTPATDDIRLYLERRLFDSLDTTTFPDAGASRSWPSPADVEALVERTNDLFIHAATVVRSIMEGYDGDARENLKRYLEDTKDSCNTSGLDYIYATIVSKALPNDAYPDMVQRFQDIVGTVIFNTSPLSVNKLVRLLGSNYTARKVRIALQYLHSVIAVPDDDDNNGIHAHHKSFVEFITSPDRCTVKTAFLDENVIYPRLFKQHFKLLPEVGEWEPSDINCRWNFAVIRPQDFRAFIAELECYLDPPVGQDKYLDKIRRKAFVQGIKNQMCYSLPPKPFATIPTFNEDNPCDTPRRIHLIPQRDSLAPSEHDLWEGRSRLVIGGMTDRPPHGVSVRYNSLVVSPAHAEIFVDHCGLFFVQDIGSGLGTFLNGARLSATRRKSAPHVLKDGDVLRFGEDSSHGKSEHFRSVSVRIGFNP